jgi:integrase
MARRGGNRLKYQVEQAIKEINFIGTSKKEARKEGASGIHSTTQVQHALSVSQNFAKWAKDQHQISDLYQLKRVHYREYIEYMKTTGVTNGHLINIETNLRLLGKGMAAVAAAKGQRERDWIPKTRLVEVASREKPINRALEPEKVQSLRLAVSNSVGTAMDLGMAFGLRLREVANTTAAHIVEKGGTLYWKAAADPLAPNSAKGVTKAGRPRETPVKPSYERLVREMIQGKAPTEKMCSVAYNTLKSAYTRHDVGGSHAFRHTYARDMVMLEFQKRGIAVEGRQMLQRMLENREKGFRKDHLVKGDERALYKQVNQVIDEIHGYLGHGKGRIDLCEVYMSF